MEPVKKISPSQIVKFLFPDAYKDIPEWILEKAADFGKDLHESIQAYIDHPDLDCEIKEALITDNKVRLYEAFKKWFEEEEIIKPKTELYVETDGMCGFIDLIDFQNKKFYDYKFRNVDKKLDLSKDIIQMMSYQYMLYSVYEQNFNWELVVFDKKTAKIYLLKSSYLEQDYKNFLIEIIEQVYLILIHRQYIKTFNKDDLEKWEPWIITDLKYQAYLKDGDPGDR